MNKVRICILLSRDAHQRLRQLAEKLDMSQSGLFESLIWLLSDEEFAASVRSRLVEKATIEAELRAWIRRMSPAEARKLLDASDESRSSPSRKAGHARG